MRRRKKLKDRDREPRLPLAVRMARTQRRLARIQERLDEGESPTGPALVAATRRARRETRQQICELLGPAFVPDWLSAENDESF